MCDPNDSQLIWILAAHDLWPALWPLEEIAELPEEQARRGEASRDGLEVPQDTDS
jgi:hypothetical protein